MGVTKNEYIEDLIKKEHLSKDESSELSKEIFAKQN